MFEDIIGDEPIRVKSISWDFEQYKQESYCYACGSKNVRIYQDKLYGDRLENDVKCLNCGSTWREVWNKDVDLDLKELKIGCLKI